MTALSWLAFSLATVGGFAGGYVICLAVYSARGRAVNSPLTMFAPERWSPFARAIFLVFNLPLCEFIYWLSLASLLPAIFAFSEGRQQQQYFVGALTLILFITPLAMLYQRLGRASDLKSQTAHPSLRLIPLVVAAAFGWSWLIVNEYERATVVKMVVMAVLFTCMWGLLLYITGIFASGLGSELAQLTRSLRMFLSVLFLTAAVFLLTIALRFPLSHSPFRLVLGANLAISLPVLLSCLMSPHLSTDAVETGMVVQDFINPEH